MMILAQWSLILLCFSMAGSVGGGLYEHIVLTPLWSASPPSSFSIIQRGTGVPLQRFWLPVRAAITVFILLTLILTWYDITVLRLLLIALVSYIIMRAWSALFFIRERLGFKRFLSIRLHLQNSQRESLGGRIGRGSESARYNLLPLLSVGSLLAQQALKHRHIFSVA